MRISRLALEAGGGAPALDVRLDPDIAVVALATRDLGRVRSALADLLVGRAVPGTAFVTIDGTEIAVSAELAPHIARRLGAAGTVIDHRSGRAAGSISGPADLAISLRAALESLGHLPTRLDLSTVDAALQTVEMTTAAMAADARASLAEADQRAAAATSALDRIEHWRNSVEWVRAKSDDGRDLQRWYRRPFARKLIDQLVATEHEVLDAGGFADYQSFSTWAGRADIEFTDALAAAETDAERLRKQLVSLEAGTSRHPDVQVAKVEDYILKVRRRDLVNAATPSEQERTSLHNCLRVMLRYRHGADDPTTTIETAHRWLGTIEGERLRRLLATTAAARLEPVAILGTLPLVLDHPFADMDQQAVLHALGGLDPLVGTTQVILLGSDDRIEPWLTAHRRR